MKKLFTLAAAVLASVAMFAATETITKGTDKTAWVGTSVTVSAQAMTGSDQNKKKDGDGSEVNYVKFRTNMDGYTMTFTVNENYKVTGIRVRAYSNNKVSKVKLASVSVDAVAVTPFTVVEFPGSDANTTATYEKTGLEAKSNIVLTFNNDDIITDPKAEGYDSNNKNCQIMANIVITYELDATTYTVTYKANNGTEEADVVDDNALTVQDNNTFTAPSGKLFNGWNTEANGSGDPYAVNASVTSDLTLYAQWEDAYTVTFNLQGHGDAIDPQTIIKNGKVTKPANPSAAGFSFEGWYKEAACENEWDFENDVITAATELFAKWVVTTECAKMEPSREASGLLVVGEIVVESSESYGGRIVVAGTKIDSKTGDTYISYTASGLQVGGGSADSLRVELDHYLKEGSTISLQLAVSSTGDRGFTLRAEDNSVVSTTALVGNWSDKTEVKVLSYTVQESDTKLIGSNIFILQRSNTALLQAVKIYNCGADVPNPPTAVDNTVDNAKAIKTIENGQLVIIKNGVKYNVLGAELR